MDDRLSLDIFADAPERAGRLGCAVEIAATMAQAIERARQIGRAHV